MNNGLVRGAATHRHLHRVQHLCGSRLSEGACYNFASAEGSSEGHLAGEHIGTRGKAQRIDDRRRRRIVAERDGRSRGGKRRLVDSRRSLRTNGSDWADWTRRPGGSSRTRRTCWADRTVRARWTGRTGGTHWADWTVRARWPAWTGRTRWAGRTGRTNWADWTVGTRWADWTDRTRWAGWTVRTRWAGGANRTRRADWTVRARRAGGTRRTRGSRITL